MTDTIAPFRSFTVHYASSAPTGRVTPGPTAPVFECIVGEWLSLAPDIAFGDLVCQVTSAPAKSASPWTGASFTPDTPGRYKLTARNGTTIPVAFEVVALPPEALEAPGVAHARFATGTHRDMTSRRRLLRSIVNGALHNGYEPRPTDDDYAKLTAARPLPLGLNFASFDSASTIG